MGLAAAQQGFLRTNANNPGGAPPPLTDGWTEEDDGATRAKFYTHSESGVRTWVRPGFVPPGGGGGGPPPGAMSGGGHHNNNNHQQSNNYNNNNNNNRFPPSNGR